jgi:type I restriction enzyme M protein
LDVELLRRRFHTLHSSLRDEGHNPLEAVSLLAETLAPNGHKSDARLSGAVMAALEAVASESTAGSLSVAFQQFMVSEARNGLGQYLTPPPVAEFIASFAVEGKPATVLDPFGGSGLLLERVADRLPQAKLIAIEINPAVAQVARAASRLARHPIDVVEADAFARWTAGELPIVDAVETNPPFGAVATRATRESLANVGVHHTLLELASLPAELLGLELSIAVLREGGFLAIVLPQSVMTNNRLSPFRADLFRRIRPLAVVSLPEETFAPFKGVAKACVLLANKATSSVPVTFPYLRSRSIGYDDTGRPSGVSDLPDVEGKLRASPRTASTATVDADGRFLIPPAIGAIAASDCTPLGDIADVFIGRTPPRGNRPLSGPSLLSVGALSGSFISWRSRSRGQVPVELYQRNKRAHVQIGDICLTAAAHKPRYIGLKVDLVDSLPEQGAMASSEVMVIRLREGAPLRAVQLLFYLRSSAGYNQVQDLVRGSTAHLYPSDVNGLLVPPLGADVDALQAAFDEAARHFRLYLAHEDEATRLGLPQGSSLPDEAGD